MATFAELISDNSKLSADEADHLAELVAEWRLLADLSFADLVLWLLSQTLEQKEGALA